MKTKGMGIALLSTAALLGSAVAQAELPWTYAEFGYSSSDGSDAFEAASYDLKGSIAFAEKWHASLSYTDGDTDSNFTDNDGDYDGFQLIVGAHPQLTPNTQLITDITYFDYDADGGEGGGFGDINENGYGLGFGLRHALTDKLEIMSEVWWVQGNFEVNDGNVLDEDFHETYVQIGGRYNWMPQLSTGLTVGINGDQATSAAGIGGDVIRFDVRWSFGDVL